MPDDNSREPLVDQAHLSVTTKKKDSFPQTMTIYATAPIFPPFMLYESLE